MVKLNKIYTRTGDDGTTGLVDGSRIAKSAPLMAAIGDVDEANSAIGLAAAALDSASDDAAMLSRIQNEMFDLGADLATPPDIQFGFGPHEMALRIVPSQIARLEDRIIGEHTRRERLRLGPLRREIVRLGRQLHGLRGVFHRLDVSPDVPITEETRKAAARLYQRMDTLFTDVHALQDRARLLYDELANRLTAETNRQLYILTILATFMMPPTLIVLWFQAMGLT